MKLVISKSCWQFIFATIVFFWLGVFFINTQTDRPANPWLPTTGTISEAFSGLSQNENISGVEFVSAVYQFKTNENKNGSGTIISSMCKSAGCKDELVTRFAIGKKIPVFYKYDYASSGDNELLRATIESRPYSDGYDGRLYTLALVFGILFVAIAGALAMTVYNEVKPSFSLSKPIKT